MVPLCGASLKTTFALCPLCILCGLCGKKISKNKVFRDTLMLIPHFPAIKNIVMKKNNVEKAIEVMGSL